MEKSVEIVHNTLKPGSGSEIHPTIPGKNGMFIRYTHWGIVKVHKIRENAFLSDKKRIFSDFLFHGRILAEKKYKNSGFLNAYSLDKPLVFMYAVLGKTHSGAEESYGLLS